MDYFEIHSMNEGSFHPFSCPKQVGEEFYSKSSCRLKYSKTLIWYFQRYAMSKKFIEIFILTMEHQHIDENYAKKMIDCNLKTYPVIFIDILDILFL